MKNKFRRFFLELHPVHRVVIVLMAFLIFWVAVSSLLGKIQYHLIDTYVVGQETRDVTMEAYGFIHTDAAVVHVEADGFAEAKVKQGDRVAKNQAIGLLTYNQDDKKVKRDILSPEPGIVNFHPDGYEELNDVKDIVKLDFKHIYSDEKNGAPKDEKSWAVSQNAVYATIIDNLKPASLYIFLPETKNPLIEREGDAVRVRFKDLPDNVVAVVEEMHKLSDGRSLVRLNLGPMSDEFLQKRVVMAECYRWEKNLLNLPKKAIVMRKDKNGKNIPGVYIVNSGVVKWQAVQVKQEREDQVVLEMLPQNTEIILTPYWVREGELLK